MREVKLHQVTSFSSEDTVHRASNLLKSSGQQKWLCSAGGEKEASVLFQLEKACEISSVDIGNAGSAFVEVLVGRSSADDFQVLVVASSFMTPSDSKMWKNLNSVRLFNKDSLSGNTAAQKWDKVKVVCRQPFNKLEKFGLSFIKLHGPGEPEDDLKGADKTPALTSENSFGRFALRDTSPTTNLTVGSLFADRRNETSPTQASSMAAQARDASSTLVTKAVGMPTTAASSLSPRRLRTDRASSPSSRRSPSPSVQKPTGVKRASSDSPQPPAKRMRRTGGKTDVPLDEVLDGVTFALSGFKNPLRGELRDKGLALGAMYKPQWEKGCTHLIAAFRNTPKYTQVRAQKGVIAQKEWLEKCHAAGRRLSTKQFVFNSADASESSSDEDHDTRSTMPYRNTADAQPARRATGMATSAAAPTSSGGGDKNIDASGDPKEKTAAAALSSRSVNYSDSGEEEADSRSRQVTDTRVPCYGEGDSGGDTEDEIEKVRALEAKKTASERRVASSMSSGSDTEVDEDMQALAPGQEIGNSKVAAIDVADRDSEGVPDNTILPAFFHGIHFLLYGDFKPSIRKLLCRYITAYGGVIENYMADGVRYVVTDSAWDQNFDQALEDVTTLSFVRPSWVMSCHDEQKCVAVGTHEVEQHE